MGPHWKRGQVLLLRLHFFQKKATPSNSISVACLQRRLFSQIHESGKEAMASTACPFREGGQKDVFSILASVFAFSRASFGNSVDANYLNPSPRTELHPFSLSGSGHKSLQLKQSDLI